MSGSRVNHSGSSNVKLEGAVPQFCQLWNNRGVSLIEVFHGHQGRTHVYESRIHLVIFSWRCLCLCPCLFWHKLWWQFLYVRSTVT